jgi:hypothetical protein
VGADDDVKKAIAAVGAGEPVLLPTDTVYGLVTSASREDEATSPYTVSVGSSTGSPARIATIALSTSSSASTTPPRLAHGPLDQG